MVGKQKNTKIGGKGERLAAEMLIEEGYKILAKNYRLKWGEVDLVAKKNGVVVFVEVKTKTSDRFGAPWEMVSSWKLEQVKRMGRLWCREFGWEGRVRVDVVGIVLEGQEGVEVKHYENVGG